MILYHHPCRAVWTPAPDLGGVVAMARPPHVALLVETSSITGRRILQGIASYLRSHPPWSVFVEQRALETVPPRWLETWRGDGIISRWNNPDFAASVRKARVPAIDLTHRGPLIGLPRIASEDRVIGRLAAEHLLERGFRALAFCGFTGIRWSTRRKESFLGALGETGEAGHVYESPWGGPDARSWEQDQTAIGRWLKHLPKPVGVMACNDVRGLHVLDACRRVGLHVPEEVAVIGVDDDPLLCELCDPPLSSVIPNMERIGYEAAELLDRLMAGEEADFEERLVPPLGLATRLSTDVLAIDDARVVAAVRFIRTHACHGITVGDVLGHTPLSRTALERQFRRYLGRSPQAEIRAVQLKRVRQLLAETDLKMDRIAELAGFEYPQYLNTVFKRELGLTPGQFRREARASRRGDD
jgi:LacI family transcriptional regulator